MKVVADLILVKQLQCVLQGSTSTPFLMQTGALEVTMRQLIVRCNFWICSLSPIGHNSCSKSQEHNHCKFLWSPIWESSRHILNRVSGRRFTKQGNTIHSSFWSYFMSLFIDWSFWIFKRNKKHTASLIYELTFCICDFWHICVFTFLQGRG